MAGRRPPGVTLLGAFGIFIGALAILLGPLVMLGYLVFFELTGEPFFLELLGNDPRTILVALGSVILVLGLVILVLSVALLRGKRWARIGSMILAGVWTASNLGFLVTGDLSTAALLFLGVFIVVYLTRPRVKEFFIPEVEAAADVGEVCLSCGAKREPDLIFCRKCGTPYPK